MALFRTISSPEPLPPITGDGVVLRTPQMGDFAQWAALRERGGAVLGATSKAAALARADRVVVLLDGEVADIGPWSELQERWNHLAG